jgi:AraC-like DNA-binding protein
MTHLESHCLLSSCAIAERSLLWKQLAAGISEDIETVERSFSIVSSALRNLRKHRIEKRPSRQRIRSHQIECAQIALLKTPDKKWRLSDLANAVSMSPYHLTRIFHEEVGIPLHQYQLRIRIAGAIDSLLDTNDELTQIAFDYGFSSHSHFTSVFRKMIGMTPAELRKQAAGKKIKETRKKLIAH